MANAPPTKSCATGTLSSTSVIAMVRMMPSSTIAYRTTAACADPVTDWSVSRARLASELETWRLRDPIERVRSYLARTGEADGTFFERVEAEADELAAKLRAACLALPDPPPLALFDHVYAEPGAILDAEREQFAAYLAGFEEEGAE